MSYNGLTVPLDCGVWSCELVPAVEYRSPSGVPMRFISGDELKLLEDDSRTFTRYFRPRYDFRQTVTTDIDAIRSFMRDHLNVAHWNQPTDNAGIEHILKQAVADGRLVPVIDRDRRIPVRTGQVPHAPQHWGETYRIGGGGAASSPRPKTFHQSVMESMGLDADGATAYIIKYNAMVERIDAVLAKNAARRAATAAAGSDSLPAMAEAAAGAVFGDNDSDGSDDAGDNLFSDAAGNTPTPLGDAQPFEYRPDMPSGDVQELAGGEGTPGNNQAQNKQFKAVVKALGLNQDQARQLHDEISKQGLGYHEMLERGQDLFGGGDD